MQYLVGGLEEKTLGDGMWPSFGQPVCLPPVCGSDSHLLFPWFFFPLLSSPSSLCSDCLSLSPRHNEVGEEDGDGWGLSGECESRTGAGSRLASIRGHSPGSSVLVLVTVLDTLDQGWESRHRKLGAEIIRDPLSTPSPLPFLFKA